MRPCWERVAGEVCQYQFYGAAIGFCRGIDHLHVDSACQQSGVSPSHPAMLASAFGRRHMTTYARAIIAFVIDVDLPWWPIRFPGLAACSPRLPLTESRCVTAGARISSLLILSECKEASFAAFNWGCRWHHSRWGCRWHHSRVDGMTSGAGHALEFAERELLNLSRNGIDRVQFQVRQALGVGRTLPLSMCF